MFAALVLFLCAFPHHVHASTDVSQDITADTTWSSDGSPYVVRQSIQVAEGATLTILPGTVVQFSSDSAVGVHGAVDAEGAAGQEATFIPSPDASGGYAGFAFLDGSKGTFKHALFQNTIAAITAAKADIEVDDSSFSGGTGGIMQTGGSLILADDAFSGLLFPVRINPAVSFAHAHTSFSGNQYNGFTVQGGTVDADITFSGDDAPYYLLSDLYMHGHALAFLPGAHLFMQPSGTPPPRITVYGGSVNANGTPEEPVVIKPDIFIYQSTNAAFSQAALAMVQVSQDVTLTMDHIHMGEFMVSLRSHATVTDSVFDLVDKIILIDEFSSLVMRDSTVSDTVASPLTLGAIQVQNTATVDLTDVTIHTNNNGVLIQKNGVVTAERLSVTAPNGAALHAAPSNEYAAGGLTLHDSTVTGSMYGLKLGQKVVLDISGNDISGNTYGAYGDGTTAFTLAQNWWGDASGPYNAVTNPAGTGDPITNAIDPGVWLDSDPVQSGASAAKQVLSDPQPDPVPEMPSGGGLPIELPPAPVLAPKKPDPKHVPVIIVPGILGTELGTDSDTLWMNLAHMAVAIGDAFMDPLSFTRDLAPSDSSVTAKNIIRSLPSIAGVSLFDYSDGLMDELAKNGYENGTDIFVFPYDWRASVSENARLLAQKISDVRHASGSDQVDIVAHSMGGLVVKQYAMDHQSDAHVRKAVFVGVPDLGAPKAAKVLLEGDSFGIPVLSGSEMRKIAQNMPSVYDLLPSERYYELAGSFMDTLNIGVLGDDLQPLSFAAFKDYFLGDRGENGAAFSRSEQMHGSLDAYDLSSSGMDSYAIEGCGTGTIGNLTEVRPLGSEALEYAVASEVSGDGTVPFASARHLSVPARHVYFAVHANHSGMLSAPDTRTAIAGILLDSTQTATGTVTQDPSRCGLTGVSISIFSPVALSVTDQDGNRAGVRIGDTIENTIPGADYERLGEHTYAYVPTDSGQSYTITLAGTGTGTFSVAVSRIDHDTVTDTELFERLPVTPNVRGTLLLGEHAQISLDTDNDGMADTHADPNEVLSGQDAAHAIEHIYAPAVPSPENAVPERSAAAIASGNTPVDAALKTEKTDTVSLERSAAYAGSAEPMPMDTLPVPKIGTHLTTAALAAHAGAAGSSMQARQSVGALLVLAGIGLLLGLMHKK